MAILLIFVALAFPLLAPRVRADERLKLPVLIVLVAHQIVAILQVQTGGLPTMRSDALRFNAFAMRAMDTFGHDPYARFLRAVYDTLGGSHLLGCEVSQIWFGLALLIEIEILYFLGCGRTAPKLVLLFGLLPSCVLNASVTLREPVQMTLFLALTYLLLEMVRRGFTSRTFFLLPLSYLLTLAHQGFAAILAICLPLALAWALKARPVLICVFIMCGITGGFFLKDRVMNNLTERSAAFRNIVEGNLDYIEDYAEKVRESRTSFGVSLDLGSVGSLVRSGPLLFFYYLYSPLPWQARGILDLYGLFESIIRLLLTYYAAKTIRASRGERRSELLLLLMLFLVVELAWAAGTANWGTAFRHRLVGWGLLVAMGGPGLVGSESSHGEGLLNAGTGDIKRRKLSEMSVRERRRTLRERRGDSDTTPAPKG